MFLDSERQSFYQFAMSIFKEAGHMFTPAPEYYNHTAKQFIYFDNKPDILLSPADRAQLNDFDNVSRLFTANGCVFFSINLSQAITRSDRSEAAHRIHVLIYPIIEAEGTVCIFRHEDEVMLSFMGYGYHCILSDWYPMFDPYEQLLRRLDIINISIDSHREYFDDLVYTLARPYYTFNQNTSPISLIPVDCVSKLEREEITREDINEMIREKIPAYKKYYGDDYVEYDETAPVKRDNIASSLDLMLLDMDMESDNPFGEETADDDFNSGEDDFLERDEYEFSNYDPEVFKDPTLLVKLLRTEYNRHT